MCVTPDAYVSAYVHVSYGVVYVCVRTRRLNIDLIDGSALRRRRHPARAVGGEGRRGAGLSEVVYDRVGAVRAIDQRCACACVVVCTSANSGTHRASTEHTDTQTNTDAQTHTTDTHPPTHTHKTTYMTHTTHTHTKRHARHTHKTHSNKIAGRTTRGRTD